MLFVCHPHILYKHRFHFLLGAKITPSETENNAYAKKEDVGLQYVLAVPLSSIAS